MIGLLVVSKTGISKIFVKKKPDACLGAAGCCCCCCCVMTMDVGECGGSRFNRPSAVAETGLDTKWWRRRQKRFFWYDRRWRKKTVLDMSGGGGKNGFKYERRRTYERRHDTRDRWWSATNCRGLACRPTAVAVRRKRAPRRRRRVSQDPTATDNHWCVWAMRWAKDDVLRPVGDHRPVNIRWRGK